jgi:hypothetical protein
MIAGLSGLAVCVGSASAHLTHPLRGDHRDLTTARRSLAHSLYVCARGTGRPHRIHCRAIPWLRQVVYRLTPHSVPHLPQWLCIHKYEGAWNDPGSPYYGGLQMDIGFQQHFAPELLSKKGTANHWTPAEQMMVAERAYRESGFSRWPNTARYCGLL